MTLQWIVKGQALRLKAHPLLAADSKNYLKACFEFSSEWNGRTKTAVFEGSGGTVYHMLLDGDSCMVPAEVIAAPGFTVSVFGGDRLTTQMVFVEVEPSGCLTGVTPPEPTPDIYDQLIGEVEAYAEQAKEYSEQAQAHCEEAGDRAQAVVAEHDTDTDAHTALFDTKLNRIECVDANSDELLEDGLYTGTFTNTPAAEGVLIVKKSGDYLTQTFLGYGDGFTSLYQRSGNLQSYSDTWERVLNMHDLYSTTVPYLQTQAQTLVGAINELCASVSTCYGVRFEGEANSGGTVTRLYSAANLIAGVGTDSETAQNDFDAIYPWSARRRCCGAFDENGQFLVNAYEGEPGYTTDGSNGDVWVEHSLFYYRHLNNAEGIEEVSISANPLPGYTPAPLFVNADGTLRQKAYTAAYPMASVDGMATSRAGVFPAIVSLNTGMQLARTLGENYTVTTAAEWYTEWLYMVVEFATRDLQSVMMGAVNLSHSSSDVALYDGWGVNYIIVSSEAAAKYVVGQSIQILSGSNASVVVANNQVITQFATVSPTETAVYFDGYAAITAGDLLTSAAYKNGSCDGVLSSSGSPVSNTDGKHNCIYRGKEAPYGNAFEQIADVLFKRVGAGTEQDPYTYEVYFLADPTKYASGAITDEYVKLSFTAPASDGYAQTLGLDSRYPWLRLPSTTGASATTWYSDMYYYPRSEIGAARVGGYWAYGRLCGPCCWSCDHAPSAAKVNSCARLSCRQG